MKPSSVLTDEARNKRYGPSNAPKKKLKEEKEVTDSDDKPSDLPHQEGRFQEGAPAAHFDTVGVEEEVKKEKVEGSDVAPAPIHSHESVVPTVPAIAPAVPPPTKISGNTTPCTRTAFEAGGQVH